MSEKTYEVMGVTITQAQKDAVDRGELKPADIHPSLNFEVNTTDELSLDELTSVAGGAMGLKAKDTGGDDVCWPDINVNRVGSPV
jgi:hypothetical protein